VTIALGTLTVAIWAYLLLGRGFFWWVPAEAGNAPLRHEVGERDGERWAIFLDLKGRFRDSKRESTFRQLLFRDEGKGEGNPI